MDFTDVSLKKKILLGFCLVAIILLFALALFWSIKKNNMSLNKLSKLGEKSEYVIPGIPYHGAHNHLKGCETPCCNSVVSILEYWMPEDVNVSEVSKQFATGVSFNSVVSFLSQKGFSAQAVKLTVDDFKDYINPKDRTPLMLFLPMDVNQPDSLGYYPATILVGINENNRTLTFYNHWLGNNYEMSYDKFDQLENKLQPDMRGLYIVVQPKDLDGKLREVSQRESRSYPQRTSIMQNGEQMFSDYGIGANAYGRKMYNIAIDYFFKVEKSSNFNDYFPPYFRTRLFSLMGEAYYNEDDLGNAFLYAQKAVAEDHDLNQPFRDWNAQGFSRMLPGPYSLLGDIYRQRKDFQNARDNYTKALSITPDNMKAKSGIAILDALKK